MSYNDWRLTNQVNYLFKKQLKKGKYVPYKENWNHDHCAFCSEKIDANTTEAYATLDNYHWICIDCFEDFKEMFQWTLNDDL